MDKRWTVPTTPNQYSLLITLTHKLPFQNLFIISFTLPLYQNTAPSSCGPFDILQVKFISLPVLTYKSAVPNTTAFSSTHSTA